MDAISRNTSSVAQDFHKAGGVHELKLPANHQLLFNNKLPAQWTTKEAAALLQSLSNANNLSFVYQQQQQHQHQQLQQQQRSTKYATNTSNISQRHHHHHHHNHSNSSGEDEENTPSTTLSPTSSRTSSCDDISPLKIENVAVVKAYNLALNNNAEQRKAISRTYLHKNYDLQEQSSNSSTTYANDSFLNNTAAANNNNNNNNNNHNNHNNGYDIIKSTTAEIFNEEDQENQEQQLIISSPAYKYNNTTYYNNNNNNNNNNLTKNYNNNNNNNNNSKSSNNSKQQQTNHYQQHRLDLQHNKENNNNAATFLTQMEFQNLNKIGTQFQNYVKDIISKYYAAETPITFPNMPIPTTTGQLQTTQPQRLSPKRKRVMSETEEYIEYLKNKEDITLTITPKNNNNNNNNNSNNALQKQSSLSLKRERDLASDNYKRIPPKKQMLANVTAAAAAAASLNTTAAVVNCVTPLPLMSAAAPQKPPKKSLQQLATLLPLLADAASQQQYLAAPLDFSKKPSCSTTEIKAKQQPVICTKQEIIEDTETKVFIKQEPLDDVTCKEEPTLIQTQLEAKTCNNFSVKALLKSNNNNNNNSNSINSNHNSNPNPNPNPSMDKRSSRKQAQPKKIRCPPELVIAMLRDKYLNRMVDHKLGCKDCIKSKRSSMLVFNYHTTSSLCLHRLWKHSEKPQKCKNCGEKFKQKYQLKLHQMKQHKHQKKANK